MFIDWLSIKQDFDFQLPEFGKEVRQTFDAENGDLMYSSITGKSVQSSYDTSIRIRATGNRLEVSGNPSRFGRTDNLFGLTDLDDAVAVYNRLLMWHNLPPFTKHKKWEYLQQKNDNGKLVKYSRSAIITKLDLTSNISVGKGNESDYIRALGTQTFRNSTPHVYTNFKSVYWGLADKNRTQKTNNRYAIHCAYDKYHEIARHAKKVIKKLRLSETEIFYLEQLQDFCRNSGVVRFENKLGSQYLHKQGFKHWGTFNLNPLKKIHDEFLALNQKLQVSTMDFTTISDTLLEMKVCKSRQASNATQLVALQWMHGHKFDFSKSQVNVHRSRLRKIGIDIKLPHDASIRPIQINTVRPITVQPLEIPSWYKQASPKNHLTLVA